MFLIALAAQGLASWDGKERLRELKNRQTPMILSRYTGFTQ
jgi:hypothetical protein